MKEVFGGDGELIAFVQRAVGYCLTGDTRERAGAFLFYHVGKLTKSGSKVLASRVLHASVLYLPVVLGIMVFWKALESPAAMWLFNLCFVGNHSARTSE